MNLSLVGYMGSGKSSIGKFLEVILNNNFYDLDDIIIKKKKKNINKIFNFFGENYFRKEENKILKNFIKNNSNYILSVGGGTPCFFNNMEILNKKTITFYLKATPFSLFKRLVFEKKKRPILSKLNDKELYFFIKKHLKKREKFYNKSKIFINVDKNNIYNISNEIKKKYLKIIKKNE
ncbi:shikimate kinase [Candidatus Shikimatogenerans silvanidophilus]|uniref:shikimate kinase n=1 Tax=Candidatus Shikimatogenerans silvanidophilus TaxID=2782547 RepID=UPI001BAA3F2B|nr:shikimate kinase [Candidatus Shikimatogenerans silvanidophilus]